MSDTTSVYQAYQGNTYLFGGNAPYVERCMKTTLPILAACPTHGANILMRCSTYPLWMDQRQGRSAPSVVNAFAERAKAGGTKVVVANADAEMGRKRTAVQQLIAAYRNVGQRWADLDPSSALSAQHS